MIRTLVHVVTASAGFALFLCHSARAADAEVTLSALNDYSFRGVSQTESESLLELDVALTHEAFFANVFAGNVDFGDSVDGDLEVDFTAGWAHEARRGLHWDVAAAIYSYPGSHASFGDPDDDSDDVVSVSDYLELNVGIEGERFAVRYWYSPDLYAAGDTGSYLEGSLGFDLPAALALHLRAGYSFGDYYDAIELANGADAAYWDFAVGIERSVKRVDIGVEYVWTDSAYEVNRGALRNDARFIVSVGTTFAFGAR